MITIIKPGKMKHEMNCRQCECKFEYDAEDVTRRTVWDDHGGHYPVSTFYEIHCPCCKRKIELSREIFNEDELSRMICVDD